MFCIQVKYWYLLYLFKFSNTSCELKKTTTIKINVSEEGELFPARAVKLVTVFQQSSYNFFLVAFHPPISLERNYVNQFLSGRYECGDHTYPMVVIYKTMQNRSCRKTEQHF